MKEGGSKKRKTTKSSVASNINTGFHVDSGSDVGSSIDDQHDASTDDGETTLFIRKAAALIASCPPEIAGWSADGESFYVNDTVAFARDHIPKIYRHSKYASFVRQLHVYGFHKVANNSASATPNVFKHPYFVRDKPELMRLLQRQSNIRGDDASSISGTVLADIEQLKVDMKALEDNQRALVTKVEGLVAEMALLKRIIQDKHRAHTESELLFLLDE